MEEQGEENENEGREKGRRRRRRRIRYDIEDMEEDPFDFQCIVLLVGHAMNPHTLSEIR